MSRASRPPPREQGVRSCAPRPHRPELLVSRRNGLPAGQALACGRVLLRWLCAVDAKSARTSAEPVAWRSRAYDGVAHPSKRPAASHVTLPGLLFSSSPKAGDKRMAGYHLTHRPPYVRNVSGRSARTKCPSEDADPLSSGAGLPSSSLGGQRRAYGKQHTNPPSVGRDHSITKHSRTPPLRTHHWWVLCKAYSQARVWTRLAPGPASNHAALEPISATHPKGLQVCTRGWLIAVHLVHLAARPLFPPPCAVGAPPCAALRRACAAPSPPLDSGIRVPSVGCPSRWLHSTRTIPFCAAGHAGAPSS